MQYIDNREDQEVIDIPAIGPGCRADGGIRY